ncbi:hypothetical protein NG798_07955 [Ancylothrix sp. C2]|uniref:hypothetical protein n=1 Tax=Ancylothrix sp. D3o TaxID=2953691 RepID=UPI0021BABE52|nr:hypothetical protein [Ancylothrix sp. D3o]MCT7949718.1 hypothetical protein [Ancylothrix sp. D3o]
MVAVQIWNDEAFEDQEAITYRAGQKVELKNRPGKVYTIAEYDAMMVPPVWLEGDAKPRYPEELNLVQQRPVSMGSVNLPSGCKIHYIDFQGHVKILSKTC